MTKEQDDQVMSEAIVEKEEETIATEEEEDLQDISALLDSVHIFTSSSSQIPVQQKSLVLQNLVKLSLPNVKIFTAMKKWSSFHLFFFVSCIA